MAANVASGTGRMSGYTFTDTAVPQDERLVFKASQLHKCLSWAQLGPALDQTPPAAADSAGAYPAGRPPAGRLRPDLADQEDHRPANPTRRRGGVTPDQAQAGGRVRPRRRPGRQRHPSSPGPLTQQPDFNQPTSPIPGRQAGGTNVHDRGL